MKGVRAMLRHSQPVDIGLFGDRGSSCARINFQNQMTKVEIVGVNQNTLYTFTYV